MTIASRMQPVLRRSALCLALLLPLDLPAQGMKGDSVAISLAKGLIERMGGARQWSRANWLYARERASFANRDSVMYVRFARDDPGLRLVSTGPLSFTVIDDADGANPGEYPFGRGGELVRWSRRFGTSAVEYVYGPPP